MLTSSCNFVWLFFLFMLLATSFSGTLSCSSSITRLNYLNFCWTAPKKGKLTNASFDLVTIKLVFSFPLWPLTIYFPLNLCVMYLIVLKLFLLFMEKDSALMVDLPSVRFNHQWLYSGFSSVSTHSKSLLHSPSCMCNLAYCMPFTRSAWLFS